MTVTPGSDIEVLHLWDTYAERVDRTLDVHVQGAVSGTSDSTRTMVPRVGELDILDSLANLCQMGYDGFIALELNCLTGLGDFEAALSMVGLRIMSSSQI